MKLIKLYWSHGPDEFVSVTDPAPRIWVRGVPFDQFLVQANGLIHYTEARVPMLSGAIDDRFD